MSHLRILGLAAVVLVAGGIGWAGEYNDVLNIGDAAPAWVDLPGVDGKQHSLVDLKDKEVAVVVFTCNSCPVAVDYEDRIVAFAKKYATPESKVALVAINVNKIPADSLPNMKERAKEKDFLFPYLYDETQKIARSFGATRTPEFFVLNKERKVIYMGALDNNSNPEKATTNHLEPAVEAALKGKRPAITETPASGCGIRFQRERK